MPGAVDNDDLVLRMVEDVIRAATLRQSRASSNAQCPRVATIRYLESLQSLVLRGDLVRVRAILDFTDEERASDLDLYYPVSTVRTRPESM